MLFEIFDFQASDFILKTSVDWDALSDDAQLSDTTQADSCLKMRYFEHRFVESQINVNLVWCSLVDIQESTDPMMKRPDKEKSYLDNFQMETKSFIVSWECFCVSYGEVMKTLFN